MRFATLVLAVSLPEVLGRGVLAIVTYAALGLLLLLLGYFVVDWTTPGKLGSVIRGERNPNAAMLAASGIAGVTLIVVAAIFTSGGNLVEGLTEALVFGVVGIAAQAVASLILERVIGMNPKSLMAEPTLSPAAVLVGVTRVGIGLITAFALI
ncbi:MAG TPA: DUF350 domain-containing protein [Candidatus Dormibacteraeota bacterium]|jgi:uncharacterized membrane protein YjfL (UPF0719 family)